MLLLLLLCIFMHTDAEMINVHTCTIRGNVLACRWSKADIYQADRTLHGIHTITFDRFPMNSVLDLMDYTPDLVVVKIANGQGCSNIHVRRHVSVFVGQAKCQAFESYTSTQAETEPTGPDTSSAGIQTRQDIEPRSKTEETTVKVFLHSTSQNSPMVNISWQTLSDLKALMIVIVVSILLASACVLIWKCNSFLKNKKNIKNQREHSNASSTEIFSVERRTDRNRTEEVPMYSFQEFMNRSTQLKVD